MRAPAAFQSLHTHTLRGEASYLSAKQIFPHAGTQFGALTTDTPEAFYGVLRIPVHVNTHEGKANNEMYAGFTTRKMGLYPKEMELNRESYLT